MLNNDYEKSLTKKVSPCMASAPGKGGAPNYHLCKYIDENHEGQHTCCACDFTWD